MFTYNGDTPELLQRGKGTFWQGTIYGWSWRVYEHYEGYSIACETKLSDDNGEPAGPATVYELLGCDDAYNLLPDASCGTADEHQFMNSVTSYDGSPGTAYLDDEPTK
jgi:hypothetical protein